MSISIKHEGDNIFQDFIQQLTNGAKLAEDQVLRALQIIKYGGATPAQIAAFLTAMQIKGQDINEIAGTEYAQFTESPALLEAMEMIDTEGEHRYNPVSIATKKLANDENLSREESTEAFETIMNGGANPAQVAAFLVVLKMRGETVSEITGGAAVLRAKAPKFNGVDGMMDTCGTGGDAKGTYNISTATAIVLAACGIPIAKHGNRAVSSKAGSADLFSELGVKLDASTDVLEKSLRDIGMCFLFAPQFHSAMKHVAPVRQELGMRTIFNLLGPLANPADPKRQLLGVYDKEWIEPIAHVLHELGSEKAWVVHGSDGMDELTLCGKSYVAQLENGEITTFTVLPEDAGLETVAPAMLQGGNAAHNTQALREILLGGKGAFRDAVLLNAAAGLMIADKATDLKQGVAIASDAIDEGKAYKLLQQLIEASHERV